MFDIIIIISELFIVESRGTFLYAMSWRYGGAAAGGALAISGAAHGGLTPLFVNNGDTCAAAASAG